MEMSWGDDGRGLCFVMTRGQTGTGLGFKKSEDSSSDVEGVSGIPSRYEHGLEDKEEVERVGDETCPETGMGGCGNLNDTSVKVSRNEPGDCAGLEDSVGGLGAGRGANRVSSNRPFLRRSISLQNVGQEKAHAPSYRSACSPSLAR